MAKQKKPTSPSQPKDLPEPLEAILELAKAHQMPTEADDATPETADLFGILSPSQVMVASASPGGADKQLLRQPILTLYWSPGMGMWTVSITDRQLKVKVTVNVPNLTTALVDASKAIRDRAAEFKSLEK